MAVAAGGTSSAAISEDARRREEFVAAILPYYVEQEIGKSYLLLVWQLEATEKALKKVRANWRLTEAEFMAAAHRWAGAREAERAAREEITNRHGSRWTTPMEVDEDDAQ